MILLVGGVCVTGRAQAVEPRDLLQVVDFGVPAVSPDGTLVAFRVEQASIERNTYDAFWYVQRMDGASPPRRIADGGVVLRDSAGLPLPAVAQWSPDGRGLYYRALVNGKLEVWRASADGTGAMPVTRDPADVREFRLSADGRTLTYSVGATRDAVRDAEQAEYDRGIHIDSTVPVGQGLFRSGNLDGRLATQRYGNIWFDRVPLLADVPDRWKAMDLHSQTTRDLDVGEVAPGVAFPGAQVPAAWRLARGPEDGRLAILTRIGEREGLRDRPNVQLSAVLPGHGESVCTAAPCTGKAITGVAWRAGHDEVLFTVSDPAVGGAQSLYRWNVRAGSVARVAQSAGLLNGGREPDRPCAVSAAMAVCVSATVRQPPRLERIDLETGRRKVLFDPNAALAQAMGSIRVRLLRWTDAQGRVFTGQFYPAAYRGAHAPALFVNYYRCAGFLRGGVGDEWPFASLAMHGISALCVNASPYALDPVRRFEDGLSAVESAVRLLSANDEIDCRRVGMGGLSFGSEVTVWVAMKSHLLAAASVSSASVSPGYYLLGSLKGKTFAEGIKDSWKLGAPEDTPAQWRMLSPAFNLDRISAPILFQMPEQEYLQAVDYLIPLIKKDLADLYVFPNEPHQKFQPVHKLAVYERNMDWFGFWLQGIEDADPAKAGQYARWHALREQVKRERSSAPLACGGGAGSR